MVLDTVTLIHEPVLEYWKAENEYYLTEIKYNMPSAFERDMGIGVQHRVDGDRTLAMCEDLFYNGFGIKWSDAQIKIYNVFIDGMLPRIFGKDWPDVKDRVLKQRGLDNVSQESLVNMGRRNGKTWIVSACCVIAFLLIPGISIAIFSVGKRQSGMFLQCCLDRIENAFNKGTHVKRNDYKKISQNQETVIYELKDGSKNSLASYPGSTTVSNYNYVFPNLLFDILCHNKWHYNNLNNVAS